jgi:fluoride exporter
MLIASLVIAGAIGAPTRYLFDGFVQNRVRGVFPWGTFTINISGSLLLGLVTGWALYHGLGDLPRTAIATGFCGAFTTFSTFSYETVRLLEEGSVAESSLNAIGSVVAGLAAAGAGLGLMALI